MYPSSAIFFTLFRSAAADVLTSEQRAALHRASALSSLEQSAFGNVSVNELDEQLEVVPVETTHLSVLRSQSSPTPHSMASDPLSQSVPTGKDIADIHAPLPANSMQIKFAAHVWSLVVVPSQHDPRGWPSTGMHLLPEPPAQVSTAQTKPCVQSLSVVHVVVETPLLVRAGGAAGLTQEGVGLE
jgi:hypothetical protein